MGGTPRKLLHESHPGSGAGGRQPRCLHQGAQSLPLRTITRDQRAALAGTGEFGSTEAGRGAPGTTDSASTEKAGQQRRAWATLPRPAGGSVVMTSFSPVQDEKKVQRGRAGGGGGGCQTLKDTLPAGATQLLSLPVMQPPKAMSASR